ncbi:MAG: FecR domain-containing protein [Spirochaetes bacterium]|nr:FecR domain-containing protein [Spirochaetota bacterium]
MKRLMALIVGAAAVALFAGPISAEIKVLSVNGSVSYKSGQRWEPLRTLMRLTPGTKVSTGARSSAVIQIEKHTLTVNPMTMIKIYESSEKTRTSGAGAVSSTKIGLRRGSVRAKIFREQRVKTEFRVATPVATSSVRGTEELISYGPSRGMTIKVLDGIVRGDNRNGATRYLKAGLTFHQRPINSDPDPLLAEARERAIASVFPKDNTTREENTSRSFSPENFVDNVESPERIVDTKVNSNVTLYITWP